MEVYVGPTCILISCVSYRVAVQIELPDGETVTALVEPHVAELVQSKGIINTVLAKWVLSN